MNKIDLRKIGLGLGFPTSGLSRLGPYRAFSGKML